MAAFVNSDDDLFGSLVIFKSHHVVVTRIGDSGKQKYLPGSLTVATQTLNDMKGQVYVRTLAGNAMQFNAIVPGGVVVRGDEESLEVWLAKVPSLTYLNSKGKPIPTIWSFSLPDKDDYEAFLGLMYLFSRLGLEVNNNKNGDILPPAAPFTKTKVLPPIRATISASPDNSINLLENDTDDEEDTKYQATDNENSPCDSPVFAESQDIYASLGCSPPQNNRRKSWEFFSPLGDSDEE